MTRHGSFPTPDHEAGSERALSMNPPAFGDGLPRTILGRGASAFEERSRALVRDHFDFIWRLLRRTGLSPQDADDEAGGPRSRVHPGSSGAPRLGSVGALSSGSRE
jgi:hypothetical protein